VRKKIFGPKREEVLGSWRIVHNEEPHNSYTLPIIIRVIKTRRVRWAGHIACMRLRNACKILVRKHEGKRPLRKPSYRWEDNIRMNLGETG
jgi:hypothetical protein